MIRSLLDRFGIGLLAATGLALLAISVTGVAGLAGRIDAASSPATPVPSLDVSRDCPRDGHRDGAPRRDRRAPLDTPSTEL
jgi:hypothetical protein